MKFITNNYLSVLNAQKKNQFSMVQNALNVQAILIMIKILNNVFFVLEEEIIINN